MRFAGFWRQNEILHPRNNNIEIVIADIRDATAVNHAIGVKDIIFNFAVRLYPSMQCETRIWISTLIAEDILFCLSTADE
jgi:hypothetical protein